MLCVLFDFNVRRLHRVMHRMQVGDNRVRKDGRVAALPDTTQNSQHYQSHLQQL